MSASSRPADLNKAVVAITGAGSGIGRALAVQCAREGALLALSDIDEKGLQETVDYCRKMCPDVMSDRLDVGQRDEIYAWADKVNEHFGRVNVIINNAGVSLAASAEAMSDEDFSWLMDINFWGVTHGSRAFLPHLRASEWGHIINISSLFGLVSMPNQTAYNAAKFAVRGFSESLRMELLMSSDNVSISCVHPGGIKTNIVNNSKMGEQVGMQLSEAQQKKHFNTQLAKMTPERAAQIILTGMKKDRSRILVGSDAKALDLLQRTLPAKYQNIVVKIIGKMKNRIEKITAA
ncbi:SDR family NAD(P)-dependent oxidoreductase [Parendozoicomonas haliclonae]|uniref:Putative oxidoreductase SadH n=1 Tax=Parendozoicomonas haliclonae TaxID=1960125 RepID=A0A1X7ADW0_9GAMM|nr:SDR family oxidoreductase [Parendozoicomonas haliclonae]SMA32866.1 putative oxidoreductase SadH [Parendozoicomonas haliclonae]